MPEKWFVSEFESDEEVSQQPLIRAVKNEVLPKGKLIKAMYAQDRREFLPGGGFAATGAKSALFPGHGGCAVRAKQRCYLFIPKN